MKGDNFIEFTFEEFEQAINSYDTWRVQVENCLEYTFAVTKKGWKEKGVWIMIFSTVDKRTGVSRGYGEDAIRLVVCREDEDMRPLMTVSRTHRVNGWKENLRRKIDELLKFEPVKCKCGGIFVLRKGTKGAFYGCSEYPVCKETRKYVK